MGVRSPTSSPPVSTTSVLGADGAALGRPSAAAPLFSPLNGGASAVPTCSSSALRGRSGLAGPGRRARRAGAWTRLWGWCARPGRAGRPLRRLPGRGRGRAAGDSLERRVGVCALFHSPRSSYGRGRETPGWAREAAPALCCGRSREGRLGPRDESQTSVPPSAGSHRREPARKVCRGEFTERWVFGHLRQRWGWGSSGSCGSGSAQGRRAGPAGCGRTRWPGSVSRAVRAVSAAL